MPGEVTDYGTVIQVEAGQNDPLYDCARKILAASGLAAVKSHSLPACNCTVAMKQQNHDVNMVVSRVGDFVTRLIGENITIMMNFIEPPLSVHADVDQIEQALINLAINARDAMPKGGTLTFTTDLLDMDDQFISTNGFGRPGRYAVIFVADTGTGMDEAVRNMIYLPLAV